MTVSGHIAYGLLGAPLAMAALPVYIYAPRLYGDELGLGLALTGVCFLTKRASSQGRAYLKNSLKT